MIEDKSNSIVAGFVLLTALTLKNLNPLSSELNPVPVSSNFWRPSTYISSFTENGAVVNPKTGVTRVHVAIPVDGLYSNLLTVDPLSLLIANISCVTDSKPFGSTMISTPLKELLVRFAPINAPDSSFCPVIGLTITKSGIDV